MIHVKWSSPNFKVDLDHENDNIMKNGFYQRILQPSEYPKRVGAKKNFFFQTLLDGPLMVEHYSIADTVVNHDDHCCVITCVFWYLILHLTCHGAHPNVKPLH